MPYISLDLAIINIYLDFSININIVFISDTKRRLLQKALFCAAAAVVSCRWQLRFKRIPI